jgi:hypothetical protein
VNGGTGGAAAGGAAAGGAAVRVILVTVAGPSGHVDVGVRSDATPADLAWHLGTTLGVSATGSAAEHWSPPRPTGTPALRFMMSRGVSLAEAGVLDGDMVVFTGAEERGI